MQIPKLKLHWQILIALVLAVLFGYFMPEQVKYVSWLGDLFLRALNMITIPLIFTSMISGITGMGNGKSLGRLGLKTISYYIVTSLAAILTGLVLVNLVRPGVGVDLGFASKVEGIPAGNQAISDLFLNMVPANLIRAMAEGEVIGVIIFAVLFGYFISQAKPEYTKSLTIFFDACFEVMMKVTLFIIRFTPLGIFGVAFASLGRRNCNCRKFGHLCTDGFCRFSHSYVYYITADGEMAWQSKIIQAFEKHGYSPFDGIFNRFVKCNTAPHHGRR